jgi:hypothetical protein
MVATGVESCRGKFEEIFEFKGGKPMDVVETSDKISHQASVLKGRYLQPSKTKTLDI